MWPRRLLTLALTIVLVLVISGCGQSYNPERDRDCRRCDLNVVTLLRSHMLIGETESYTSKRQYSYEKGTGALGVVGLSSEAPDKLKAAYAAFFVALYLVPM